MKLGIIGLPGSGKTTVFNALTHQALPTGTSAGGGGRLTVSTAVVEVPDPRVDDLSARYRPKKTTWASVTFTDIGGLEEGIGTSGIHGPLRNELAKADGFAHVVRAFGSDGAAPPALGVDPWRDHGTLETELLLLDLVTVEHRMERLRAEWPKARDQARRANEAEAELLGRLAEALGAERPLRHLRDQLSPDEVKMVRGYGLLSLKPILVLHNVADDAPWTHEALDPAGPASAAMMVHGRLEAEIARLAPDERATFLAEYGIGEPGVARVIRAGYGLLGLISVFTVGDDEVRAWTVHAGATAVDAAGAIHTDLARGFIRAEVATYDDLVALGDMKAVKAAGKQRLEGRDYVVRDGDILTIRSGI
jgi:ribosome-binding ATPase